MKFLDREYRCLGQWYEDGLLYTYTQRREVPGYECFVGKMDGRGGVKLAEGGNNCKRGLRVDMFGMTLTKKSRNHFGKSEFCSNVFLFRALLWIHRPGYTGQQMGYFTN